jgi:hypothetical protein
LFLYKVLQYLIDINKKVLLGCDIGDSSCISNDDLIDSISVPATVMKGSKTVNILYDHITCFEMSPGDCDIPVQTRLPTVSSKGFGGLSALYDIFIHSIIGYLFILFVY